MKKIAIVWLALLMGGVQQAFAQPLPGDSVTVNTVDDLEKWLNDPNFHGTILIPDGPDLNLSGKRDLPLRDGVVLKGTRLRTTPGRLLYTTDMAAKHDLFHIVGSNVRVEGLRFRGPYGGTSEVNSVTAFRVLTAEQPSANVKLLHRNIVITNNELWAWPGAAVSVEGIVEAECFADLSPEDQATRPWHVMKKSEANQIAITQNYIHHNQRHNLGYGVVVGRGAYATIQGNVFEYNRHAVAHSGTPYSGYIARDNYNLQEVDFQSVVGPIGSYPTHYDVHGCGPGGNGGDAGEYIELAYNTIRGEQDIFLGLGVRFAFRVRGTPRDAAWFIENTVVHDDFDEATDGPVQRTGGTFDAETSLDITAGDFDGDGHDDVLVATGSGLYYSSWGQAPWKWLTRSSARIQDIRIGDFDGDGWDDIFVVQGSTWRYFSTRLGAWKSDLMGASVALARLGFGDFDGNGITDVFYADGTNWNISWNSRSAWQAVNSSQHTIESFRFGDFDGDGATDVFMVGSDGWRYSSGARTTWIKLQDARAPLNAIRLGDFDGDGYTDVAYETATEWRYAPRGTGANALLRSKSDGNTSIHKGVLGKFASGSHATRDVFIRFAEFAQGGLPPRVSLNFYFWYFFPGGGSNFDVRTTRNMR